MKFQSSACVVSSSSHKHQANALSGTVSDAVMEVETTAGQFNIVNGQLVQLINTSGTLLYAHVTVRADASVNRLKVTWGTAPDTYGTFGFQGSLLRAATGLL